MKNRIGIGFRLLGFLGGAAWIAIGFAYLPHLTQSEATRGGTPLSRTPRGVELHAIPDQVTAPGVVDTQLLVKDQPARAGELGTELVENDARCAHERATATLRLREAELEEAQAVFSAATTRLERPVHLEVPLIETEVALAKIDTQLRDIPFEIRRAEARLDFAKRDYERKSGLKGVIAGRAIEEARSSLTDVTASLQELLARKGSLRKEQEALVAYRDALKTRLELKVAETQAKSEAEAKLKAARARVNQAETLLADSK